MSNAVIVYGGMACAISFASGMLFAAWRSSPCSTSPVLSADDGVALARRAPGALSDGLPHPSERGTELFCDCTKCNTFMDERFSAAFEVSDEEAAAMQADMERGQG